MDKEDLVALIDKHREEYGFNMCMKIKQDMSCNDEESSVYKMLCIKYLKLSCNSYHDVTQPERWNRYEVQDESDRM